MDLGETRKTINANIDVLKDILKDSFCPTKLVNLFSATDNKNLISSSMITAIIGALVIYLFSSLFSFNSDYSRIILISEYLYVYSLLLVPISLMSVIFMKIDFRKKLCISINCSIVFVSLYLVPDILFIILFFVTENYTFYYIYYILLFILLCLFVIAPPIILNHRSKKLQSVLLSLIVTISLNYSIYCLIGQIDKDFLERINYDPIIAEMNSADLLNSSKVLYLLSNHVIFNDCVQEYLDNQSPDALAQAFSQAQAIHNMKEELLELDKSVKFKTNKTLMKYAINSITVVDDIAYQLSRIRIIPNGYSVFLTQASSELSLLQKELANIKVDNDSLKKELEVAATSFGSVSNRDDFFDEKKTLELIGARIEANIATENVIKGEIDHVAKQIKDNQSISIQVTINSNAMQEMSSLLKQSFDDNKKLEAYIKYIDSILQLKNVFWFIP